MGEDSNHSVMSDSQDGTDFANKINPSSSGPATASATTKDDTSNATAGAPEKE